MSMATSSVNLPCTASSCRIGCASVGTIRVQHNSVVSFSLPCPSSQTWILNVPVCGLHHREPTLGLAFRKPCRWRPNQVKSGEAEGMPGVKASFLDEQTLQRDLEIAIEKEDYARAAMLRDELRTLQEDSRVAVLAANSRFYSAFKKGDLVAMNSIWAKGDHVYVVHPAAGRISGYEMVIGSWEIVCGADYEFPLQIDLQNVEVHVRGNIGYVTCLEVVKNKGSSWGRQIATNVFERVNGKWLMCVHHASHVDS